MAIWQFQTQIIPRAVAIIDKKEDWWVGYTVSDKTIQGLKRILPLGKSWSPDLIIHGDLEGTCVSFLFDKETIIEISVRFDLRTVTSDLLGNILSFVKQIQGVLLIDGNKIVEPEISNVIDAMRLSPAFKFLDNPSGFLSNIKQECDQTNC